MDKKDIKQQIARMTANAYREVLLTGYEEQEDKFFITLSVIDFLAKFKEKKLKFELNDIFTDTIVDEIFKEASNYIGK